MAGNRAEDPSGFDGLEGVSDDELEAAASGAPSGDRSGQSQSPTPQSADPAGSTVESGESGEPSEPNLVRELGYDTKEAAIKGMHELRGYASRTKDEAETLRLENASLKAKLSGGAPAPTGATIDPLETLEKDFFVPRGVIEPAVREMVNRELMAHLQPLYAQQEADTRMAEKYGPGYNQVKDKVAAFVAANPNVSSMVRLANEKGIPEVGMEYALGAFREAVALATHSEIQQGAEAAGNAKDRGRNSPAPLQSRENTRTRLAQAQSGGTNGIDMAEAIMQANNGNDRLIDEVFASRLPSEEAMERAMRGG